MATDGERIFWNPKWVATIEPQEIEAVLIHEALHVVFEHPLRRGNRNHKLWNIACDYAINSYIVYDLRLSLPDGGLLDRKYHGMSAEQIYRILDTNDDALQDAINQANASNGESDDSDADESQGGNGDSDVSEESDEEQSSTGKYSSDEGSTGDDEQSSTGESKYDNIPTLVGEVLDAQNEDGSAKSQAELDELEQTLRSKIFLADKTASMFGDSSLGGAVNEIKGATIDWIERIRDFPNWRYEDIIFME